MSTTTIGTTRETVRGPSPEPDGPTGTAGTVLDLLDRARGGLLLACHSGTASERYTQAHLAALRAGAALLAARSAPSRRARPRSVWEVLPTVAPELTEWAVFFAGSGRRRLALERGADVVTARDADDLVRSGERFLELVRASLHLPCGLPLPAELSPVRPS
ncbi:SAV_6107 family HEPN domain-containing protein [Ornithinimicrobium sp. CNJ-824]|uniref:SAV_6107 family HEPN domain-containing protein n=1 Tax=Ornithinimicrobium sp. CNJ-824 TaxID=1904966 RepID=UPI001300EA28|nr:SAV_6107 family HEPN domain-containing protein [Ornithinimicrobium sp. CNJ-824]